MKTVIPTEVMIGKDNNEVRLIHDSGLVVLIPKTGSPSIEYYLGGVSDSQRLAWNMVTISRKPTLQEVGVFRSICEQANVALSLA